MTETVLLILLLIALAEVVKYIKKSSASTRNSGGQADINKPSLPDRFGAISYKVKK